MERTISTNVKSGKIPKCPNMPSININKKSLKKREITENKQVICNICKLMVSNIKSHTEFHPSKILDNVYLSGLNCAVNKKVTVT